MADNQHIYDAGHNAAYEFTWTSSKVTQIDKTVNGVVYRMTLTWSGDEVQTISAWVKQ